MSNIRVLHCPTMVGGNPQQLARAQREVGLESWAISFKQSPFGYESDEILYTAGDSMYKKEAKRWILLWRALKKFDFIHFNFGQSIMPTRTKIDLMPQDGKRSLKSKGAGFFRNLFELRDLSLFKRAGKGIAVTYQGNDARQGDYCLSNFDVNFATDVEPGYFSPETDALKRHRISTFARYADLIYAHNPDLLHILPTKTKFMPYPRVDPREWQLVNKRVVAETPVVVHAPSHRLIKGTHYIVDAISQIQAEGIAVDFLLVEGLKRNEARRLYEKSDLLIDQLLAGWYGGLAVELMALGKPVISYIREGDLKFIPQEMHQDMPIINSTPSTLVEVLKEWLTTRKNELPRLGKRSRAYVEKWHDPLKIAVSLKNDYETALELKR